MHYLLGIPSIVLSTLVGTSVFDSLEKLTDPRVKLLVGVGQCNCGDSYRASDLPGILGKGRETPYLCVEVRFASGLVPGDFSSAREARGDARSLLDQVLAEGPPRGDAPRNSRLDMREGPKPTRRGNVPPPGREPLIEVSPGGLSEPLAGDGLGRSAKAPNAYTVSIAPTARSRSPYCSIYFRAASGLMSWSAPKMVLNVFPEVLVKIRGALHLLRRQPAFLVRYSLQGSYQKRLCCGKEDRLPSRHSGCQSRRRCENQTDRRRTSAIVAARSQPRDP